MSWSKFLPACSTSRQPAEICAATLQAIKEIFLMSCSFSCCTTAFRNFTKSFGSMDCASSSAWSTKYTPMLVLYCLASLAEVTGLGGCDTGQLRFESFRHG